MDNRDGMRGSKRFGGRSLFLIGLVVSVVAVVLPTQAVAPGDLDPSFSGDGKQTTSIRDADVLNALALQQDGKIIAAGSTTDFATGLDIALVRYKTDGSPDPTFDGDGIVTTNFASLGESATDVAVQPDGKIVVPVDTQGTFFALARYTSTGSLDGAFDGDGKVTTTINGGNDYASAIALQPDGKIVVAGRTIGGGDADIAVLRYNANGTPDSTFSGDGQLTTNLGSTSDSATAVAIQPDGKIVVGGVTNNGSNFDFAVARYLSDGTPDSTFDGDGKTSTPVVSGDDLLLDLAIQRDGKVVAGGFARPTGGFADFAIVRYLSNGALDPTFDGDGKLKTDIGGQDDEAHGLALQRDGRIVLSGLASNPGPTGDDFAVARYRSDGSLDPTFSGDGRTTTDFASDESASDVVVQTDGKIVAGGRRFSGFSPGGSHFDFALARYLGLNPSTPGVVRGNIWYLDFGFDGHTDHAFSFGRSTDVKIAGDWDGNGSDTAGLVRGNIWYLDNGNDGHADRSFSFGRASDKKVVGDWDANGTVTVAVVRENVWYVDNGNDGHADHVFMYGRPTDRPLAGDWNGDGIDTAGVVRGGAWYLDNANDGSGYDVSCTFGSGSDTKIVGDWDANGTDSPGVVRGNVWFLNLGCDSLYEISVAFGRSTDTKLAGRWQG